MLLMRSIKIITHVEDFTSSVFENIFYYLKSHPSTFIHSEGIAIDNVHTQELRNMLLIIYPMCIADQRQFC